jgi:hypothetical protein
MILEGIGLGFLLLAYKASRFETLLKPMSQL